MNSENTLNLIKTDKLSVAKTNKEYGRLLFKENNKRYAVRETTDEDINILFRCDTLSFSDIEDITSVIAEDYEGWGEDVIPYYYEVFEYVVCEYLKYVNNLVKE